MSKNVLNREQVLQELRNHRNEFDRQYGVTKIGIFGSLARNECRENSDIDVVVEMREPDLFYLVHIKETLEKSFHRSVDIIRYRATMNHRLKARIDKEACYA
jgi:predicted nucleotidyltransferase